WLLDPLLGILIYYFLMVVILERGGENFAVYLAIGLVVWRWISASINSSAKSILRYSSIINQVYLPMSILPLSFTITQVFNFCLVVIAFFLVFNGFISGWDIVYLPFIVLVTITFLMAVGFVLGYFTVFIRDIDNLLTHIIRLFFYASPIIWVGGRLPPEYDWL